MPAEPVPAEVVERRSSEEEPTAIEVATAGPGTLYGTADPREIQERAVAQADVLIDVVKKRRLATNIGGKNYVHVEGWTFLGAMVGVFPRTVWTRKLEDGTGWEARVEAVTLDGSVVGAAEAMCQRTEKRGPWKSAEDYAVRAMAQTRATSRALRQPLGFIAVLAGFEATAREEVPEEGFSDPYGGGYERPAPISEEQAAAANADKPATQKQVQKLHIIAQRLEMDEEERHREAGVESFKDLTRKRAGELIEAWEARLPAEQQSLGTQDHEHVWTQHERLKRTLVCAVPGCPKTRKTDG